MGRRIIVLVASLLLLPAVLAAYTVVLKNGRRLEAQSRYTVEGNVARFVGTDGTPQRIPLAEIDVAATEAANREAERPRRPKVWTNDDIEELKRRPGSISVLGTAAPPPAARAEGQEVEESADEGGEAGEAPPQPKEPKETDPEYWQKKLKPLRDELAQIDQQLQQLRSGQGQASSNALSVSGSNAGVDVADTIRRLEQRRAQVQQQIEDLQLEAKRKGIAPGAVR